MFQEINKVKFPKPNDINVNMMPIIFGDIESIPVKLRRYSPFIDLAFFDKGSLAYLTIHESVVAPGKTQRRPGIHTDGTMNFGWGGGWGGGVPSPSPPPSPNPPSKPKPTKGIYMASNDGRCRIWDEITYDVDSHGALLTKPASNPQMMAPNTLYWMTDRTPHESLPSLDRHYRQFFRIVSDEVDVWWENHSTPNPIGVKPNCRIETRDKFTR